MGVCVCVCVVVSDRVWEEVGNGMIFVAIVDIAGST